MTDDPNNILSIDTSSSRLVLGLSYGLDRLIKSDNRVDKSHGQIILKKIEELFESAGLEREELQAVIVSRGPGSFTGLRIGLAAAKGLATAMDIPMYGVTLFELGAFKWSGIEEMRNLVIPSRKNEFYLGRIAGGKVLEEKTVSLDNKEDLDLMKSARIFTLEAILPGEANGNGSPGSGLFEYDGADLIELGRQRIEEGTADDPATLEPVYYQKAIAEIRFEQRKDNQ